MPKKTTKKTSRKKERTDAKGRTVGQIKKELLDVLRKSMGIVVHACRKAGISRSTFYKYREDDPEFAAEVNSINEEAVDFVESELLKNIAKGDTTAQIFFLKTKGRHRGWTERVDMTHEIKQKIAFDPDDEAP